MRMGLGFKGTQGFGYFGPQGIQQGLGAQNAVLMLNEEPLKTWGFKGFGASGFGVCGGFAGPRCRMLVLRGRVLRGIVGT